MSKIKKLRYIKFLLIRERAKIEGTNENLVLLSTYASVKDNLKLVGKKPLFIFVTMNL